MKNIKLFFALILSIWHASILPFTNKSFMTYRSQGFNLARNDAGWLQKDAYTNASLAIEYTQSFDSQAINKYFFGCNQLVFSGSRVENRGKNDILADYFGLPTDFESCLKFDPKVQNVIADLNFFWNFNCEDTGFNLRIDMPLVHTKWELNPCETVISTGTLAYPAGYMSNERIEHDDLQKNALSVLSCNQTFGDLVLPLHYGRIVNKQHATKLADILVALGYTFINRECGLLGADIHIVIPTGTRSHACTLFEPQIGNGHHWALGASLKGQYNFINKVDGWKVSGYFDGYIQHLFKTTQKRSYDLKHNGAGSRYMLLEDMIEGISIVQGFSPIPLEDPLQNQYITRLLYAIDATTLNSTIKIDVQADIVAKLTAECHNWSWDIGYNFWARSHEKLTSRECLKHKFYGVKGDAQVYGFLDVGTVEIPIPINATQSQATINAPQGAGNTTHNFVNENADNPDLMYNFGTPLAQTKFNSLTGTGVSTLEQVNGSNQAIVLTDKDIDNCSGLSPRALSHKIFGSIRYTWDSLVQIPYVIIGAEGEFAGKQNNVRTAISQWGIWIKGGINY